MKYIPKRINHAWWIIPSLLLLVGMVCFIGVSYFDFPKVVFRPLFFACFVAAIFMLSRYALQGWEYGLTEPDAENPYGKFQVFSRRGKRSIAYADLDLSMALSLIPESEDKALGNAGKRPVFTRTFSFVLNLFARDVYYLYIRFQAGNVRLRLELGDETFLCALQSRILEAAKHPRPSLHNQEDEEDYEQEDAELTEVYDPADAVEIEVQDAPDAEPTTPTEGE